MARFTGLLGLLVILAVAFLFSTNRKAVQKRVLLWGLALQFGFAFLVLKTGFGKLFQIASSPSTPCLIMPKQEASFSLDPWARSGPFGVVFAFQVLPIVIFIASLFAVLYQWG